MEISDGLSLPETLCELLDLSYEESLERVESLVRAAHQAIEIKRPGTKSFPEVAAGVLGLAHEGDEGKKNLNALCLDYAVLIIGT